MLAHDFTTERETTIKTSRRLQGARGDSAVHGLWDALARLQKVQGRRAIVVLSDGRDENNPGTAPGSLRTVSEVLDVIRESDSTIFPIGLGTKVDRPFLERLAELSGGESYFPVVAADMRGDYQRVIENLRRRYVVSYTSTNSERDGAWRDVQIRPRLTGTVVRSRGGYFAPER